MTASEKRVNLGASAARMAIMPEYPIIAIMISKQVITCGCDETEACVMGVIS
jgi:hypothetical protein